MFTHSGVASTLWIFLLLTLSSISADVEKSADDAELVPSEVETKTNSKPPAELDSESCMRKRIGCCEQRDLGKTEELMKCFTLHQSKLPKDYAKDPPKLFKFFSCFIECQYKMKKYLGKGENINMKMVKKDAEKTYAGRPKERDYHIGMYEFCQKDALNIYNMVKLNPAGRVLLKDNCKPFFMFVYMCTSQYHFKQPSHCPYFKWEGQKKSEAAEDCQLAKEKCFEIDGIVL